LPQSRGFDHNSINVLGGTNLAPQVIAGDAKDVGSKPTKEMKECKMIKGEVASLEGGTTAMTIVIAPSEKEAQEYAKKVLKPYYSGYPQRIGFFYVGPILLPPTTKTIFLYALEKGEINNIVGFCKIANEGTGCIYYPCCDPLDRGDYCRNGNCLNCNSRRCKPNPDGTISIDNVPCGRG
jgi:hypothetical protein